MAEPQVVFTAGGGGRSSASKKKKSRGKRKAPLMPQPEPSLASQSEDQPLGLEMEESTHIDEDVLRQPALEDDTIDEGNMPEMREEEAPYRDNAEEALLAAAPYHDEAEDPHKQPPLAHHPDHHRRREFLWLGICFFGIMLSFVCYGLLLEYTTSGGRKLHELSFLFVTSGLYTLTAATGRYVRDETPSTIPPARFAVLGLTSMGSTFCSVRSLKFVIYPVQVLAKSCKPVPVMIFGTLLGKRYPLRKYVNVILIVFGVALFMGGGDSSKSKVADESSHHIVGVVLLFISLCFDGGTGAYEDKLMSVHSVQPFDLMYNIQLGKTILAGIGLLVFNQVHMFLQMVQDMGFLLVALGLSGALGQVFIFVTISKFGALTCSIIGLARKVTTLVASIYFYGHHLNAAQSIGLFICVGAMVMNFWGKKSPSHGHRPLPPANEMEKMLASDEEEEETGDMELPVTTRDSRHSLV